MLALALADKDEMESEKQDIIKQFTQGFYTACTCKSTSYKRNIEKN
jgi:hypothetical protein